MFPTLKPTQLAYRVYAINILHDCHHHSLPITIREASRQLALVVNSNYRHHMDINLYRVFSACGLQGWIVGICGDIPTTVINRYSIVTASKRHIEKHHCPECMAMIIEHEINKMPVVKPAGMVSDK